MPIPDNVIDDIARKVDIVEVIGHYVHLTRKGPRYLGLCPLHNEKTPSFSVNPDRGAYYCFGCQRGGGVFKFLMDIEGLTFPEAVGRLGERVGIDVGEPEAETDASRQRRALSELYNRVAGTFHYLLRETPDGRRALETLRERALPDDALDRFGVGYAPQDRHWLHRFLVRKGYSETFLAGSGLFTQSDPRRALFSARIMFPIRSPKGDVVAFGGRIVSGDGPKYINSPETPLYRKRELLYGIDLALPDIRKSRTVTLAEGYIDVIALHEAGLTTAVAPLGTAFTTEQGQYLSRYLDSATLVFDADDAGGRATHRAAEILEPYGVTVNVCVLAPGSDPADLLRSGGSQAVVNAVSSPLSILEFLVRHGLQTHAGTPDGKRAVLKDIYGYVGLMGSEVKREESLRVVADLVGADPDAVRADFRAFAGSGGRRSRRTDEVIDSPSVQGESASLDLFLMLAAAESRDHFSLVRRSVQPEDLVDPAAKEIYLALEECYRRQETSTDLFLGRIMQPEVADMVRRRLAYGEFSESPERLIRDSIVAIRTRVLCDRRRSVELELRRVTASGAEDKAYRDLQLEIMSIDRELRKLKGEDE